MQEHDKTGLTQVAAIAELAAVALGAAQELHYIPLRHRGLAERRKDIDLLPTVNRAGAA